MLEAIEIGQKVSKAEFAEQEPDLRTELVQLQHRFKSLDKSLLIVVDGIDRAGCDDVIQRLNAWLDPRFIQTTVFAELSEEERMHPRFWRYWASLAPRGRIAVLSNAWGWRAIVERARGELDEPELERRLHRIEKFERMLQVNGTEVVKFWLHLEKDALKKRVKAAEKHEDRLWRFHEEDKAVLKNYRNGMAIVEEVLHQTNSPETPWHLIESRCPRYRDLRVTTTILDSLRHLVETPTQPPPEGSPATQPPTTSGASSADDARPDSITILKRVDLTQSLSDDEYDKALKRAQTKLHRLAMKAARKDVSAVLVFEGWDASGKGGTIRRVTAALKAQMCRVVPIGAPTEEEKSYPYLWRFWKHLPRSGKVVIFDRSWYGRVLVERVEGFASEEEWRRAYEEINEFEDEIVRHGVLLCKFWLHIDKDEQLRRFQDRESVPYKRFKITPDDWRNRERWDEYERAVNEMALRTSTPHAPWHIIPNNDKNFGRIQVVQIIADGLKALL